MPIYESNESWLFQDVNKIISFINHAKIYKVVFVNNPGFEGIGDPQLPYRSDLVELA